MRCLLGKQRRSGHGKTDAPGRFAQGYRSNLAAAIESEQRNVRRDVPHGGQLVDRFSFDMLLPLTPVTFGASLADGKAEISDNFERVS